MNLSESFEMIQKSLKRIVYYSAVVIAGVPMRWKSLKKCDSLYIRSPSQYCTISCDQKKVPQEMDRVNCLVCTEEEAK